MANQLDGGGLEYNVYREVLCDTLELADGRFQELISLIENQNFISRQYEQTLQIFERFFIESPIGYLIVSEHGEVIRLNQKARDHWGIFSPSGTKLHIDDLIDPMSIEKLSRAFDSTNRAVKKVSVEVLCRRLSGSGFWGSFEIFRIEVDKLGSLLLCAVRDISLKRASEQALQKTAIGLSAGTGLGFFTRLLHYLMSYQGVDGAVVTSVCNDGSFESLAISSHIPCGNSLRYHRPEICRQNRFQLAVKLHEPSDNHIEPFLDHFNAQDGLSLFLFDAQRSVFGEIAIVSKDTLQDKRLLGSILKIVSVRASSELERLKIEQKLTEYQEQLEEQVRLRTSDLEKKSQDLKKKNQQLFQEIRRREQIEISLQDAKKRAEEAALAKSAFLANMSHEIRTPLNGIIGLTSLVAQSELSEKNRRYLDLILESGQGLLRIVNDILEVSKLEAGQLKTESVGFSLRDLINNCFLAFEPMVRSKDLFFTVDYPYDVPDHIVSDPGRMRQILDNLVSNAIKFTESGGVIIKVRYREADAVVQISVKDTGIGLSDAQKENIFERFYQADTSPTRKSRGTGLGLAICQKISALLKGTISFTSEMDVGSEFTVAFPLATPTDNLSGNDVRCLKGRVSMYLVGFPSVLSQAVESMLLSLGMPTAIFEEWGDFSLGIKPEISQCTHVMAAQEDVNQVMVFAYSPEALRGVSGEFAAAASLFTLGAFDPHVTFPFGSVHDLTKTFLIDRFLVEQGIIEIKKKTIDHFTIHTHCPIDQGLKILIAEDNPINCEVVAGMFESLGLKVDIVHDGSEALEAHMAQDYDIIVMDCLMPNMDGFTAVKHIRTGPKPEVYVVALTANALSGDREACLAANFDEYLSKPIKLEDIIKVLSSFKKRSSWNISTAPRVSNDQRINRSGIGGDPETINHQ